MNINFHRLRKLINNLPSLLQGYNIYVDTNKLRLIDRVFQIIMPKVKSFADLGGVWKVNGAYSLYALKKFPISRSVLVDTDFPAGVFERLSHVSNLNVVKGDFAQKSVMQAVGNVDAVFFFDVLLHQANPSWHTILADYATQTRCMVIYNQQYVLDTTSVRLTDLSLEKYIAMAGSSGRNDVYKFVYEHAEEIHKEYGKPWKDIHNIFQWGITDEDLRSTMTRLGFREIFFQNYGRFSNLPAFENHAFIFVQI